MISIDSRQFLRAAALASSAIAPRSSMAVLRTLRVEANGKMALAGSDLDVTSLVEMPYTGKPSDGFCMPEPRAVCAAIKAAGGDIVKLNGGGEGAVAVESGALSVKLATLSVDDHPGAERIAHEEFAADLGAAEIAQIARVLPAMSTEETRYDLNGVHISRLDEWTWRFAATDGHRLMMVDVPMPGAAGDIPGGAIIPRRWLTLAVAVFSRTQTPIRLVFGRVAPRNADGPDLAGAACGSPRIAATSQIDELTCRLTSRLIDGVYPDYMRVVPKDIPHVVRCDRRMLVSAIRALTPLRRNRIRAVKFSFAPAKMILSLNSPDVGQSRYELGVEHNLSADAGVHVGFNAAYMLDILAVLAGEEVVLGLGKSLSADPVVITDPADTAFKAVLMPMRV